MSDNDVFSDTLLARAKADAAVLVVYIVEALTRFASESADDDIPIFVHAPTEYSGHTIAELTRRSAVTQLIRRVRANRGSPAGPMMGMLR